MAEFWYNTARNILRLYIRLFIEKIEVAGQQFIEPGPKVIVANHPNATDAFMLPFIFPDRLHFLIQEDIFHTPLLGKLLQWADQIPVIKGRGREALQKAQEKLMQGHSIAIFPEGRLTHGEGIQRAGVGAALLALRTGVPIQPVGFYVPPRFLHRLQLWRERRQRAGQWQTAGRCYVEVGEPLAGSATPANTDRFAAPRAYIENIMERVSLLVQNARQRAGI
jgi:1-acyl-sn-glycerol-3-phosphate acyltransferase